MDSHLPSWLSYSSIYLAAAVIAVPLSRALGLGSILGYLAAGIAIGPWGLGLVRNVEDILHFAEFGVVLMLFLLGLELDPRRLWNLRRSIFGWGSLQVLACTAAMAAVALLFDIGWKPALAASMGLALSSTAVSLQVMSERHMLHTAAGQAGFSILLFQDVAAIPILALLPLLAASGSDSAVNGHGLWQAGVVLGAIVALIFGGRVLLRPLLRWIAGSRSPEIFTAAALLLVVGTASIMQLAGLTMALGAFLAGVLLGETEYRRELETDLEPFKSLLLGLFFMAVGMGIEFDVLLAHPLRMAAILGGFMAIKLMLIYLLSRAMRLPLQDRPVLTLLLAQGGEFAFVVFQTAVGAHVLAPDTASLLVGAVALSMLLTPLLLMAVDRFVLPHWRNAESANPLSELSEAQHAPVIIAGFGRYGQIVGRTLTAQGIASTVLDSDPEMVEATRQFGYKVFYGDPTRLALLRTAGAGYAKVLVVAVDGRAQSLAIIDLARQHFPHLKIVARAHDVSHWYALRDRRIEHAHRELFDSSLVSARSAMELLGVPAETAEQTVKRFRAHNLALLEQMYPHHKDRAKLIAVVKRGRQQLIEQMAQERAERARRERADEAST